MLAYGTACLAYHNGGHHSHKERSPHGKALIWPKASHASALRKGKNANDKREKNASCMIQKGRTEKQLEQTQKKSQRKHKAKSKCDCGYTSKTRQKK